MADTETTSPAVELRAAARLMRERAAVVPQNWRLIRSQIVAAGTDELAGTDVIATCMVPARAAYVASMHPPVALAVAEWLETEAHMADWRGNSVEGQTFGALKVARACLGGAEARNATRDVTARSRPRVVCLCGSTRFKEAFARAGRERSLDGEIVLTVNDLAPGAEGRKVPIPADRKAMLDELHRHKIELADYVLVLNVGGYVGKSTRGEIEYARALGKPVEYLEGGTND